MPTITFKAKIQTMYNFEDKPLYEFVEVPTLARRHCDMPAFRANDKFYANSDLFIGILARIRRDLLKGSAHLRLDKLPENVTVERGFLAKVTINVDQH